MKSLICEKASKDSGLKQSDIANLLSVAKDAAVIGGEILMSHYGKISRVENKSREGDLVTNADIEAEEKILSYLDKSTPDISILAEESGSSGDQDGLKWCVDPLDGTTNFTHGYPFFCTSIGLTWKNQPILGAINIPYIKELFWGAPHTHSFCNDQIIRVSQARRLEESLLVTGFAYDRHTNKNNNYAEFCWLTHRTRGVRRGGAAAVDLAFVAAGRLDGYWERGLSPWDLAAGVAIVESAGGQISSYSGGPFDLRSGKVLACTDTIKNDLIEVLRKVEPLPQKYFGSQN